MLHPAIDFNALRCVSVLDGQGARDIMSVTLGSALSCPALILCGKKDDVLFVPELTLQLTSDRIVPVESVLFPWSLEFEVKRDFRKRAARYRQPFSCNRRELDVCILSNFYSRNFFHWITEEMIRVMVLETAGFGGSYVAVGLPDFCHQFLRLMGVAPERIITDVAGPTIFRSARYVTPVHARVARDFSDAYLHLRERLLAAASDASRFGSRIWLERRTGVNNPGRDIANPDEVMPILARYGVKLVDMAAMPVAEQIAIAHGASFLGGVHGAGFVHALFMKPQATVVECFAPVFINPGIHGICSILDLDYSMLVYDFAYTGYPDGNKVRISTEHLELVFQRVFR